MSAKKFLEVAEKSGLLDDSVLVDLRNQLNDTRVRSAESLAKYLVELGHLTKFQATKLINQISTDEAEKGEPTPAKPAEPKSEKPPRASKPAKTKPKSDDDDLLSLAPIDDETEPTPVAAGKPSAGKSARVPDEGPALEEAEGLTPVEDAAGGLTWIGKREDLIGTDHASAGLTPLPPEPISGLEPLPPADSGSLDPFGAAGMGLQPAQPAYMPKKKETRWDTKLIMGVSTTLLILIVVGAALLWHFMSVPAIAMYDAAEKAYRDAAYGDAKTKFEEYIAAYPRDENASKAKVRVYLTRIRLDSGDPERALKTALEVIPELVKEKDADIAREEFPGLLPQIPEGFVNRAKQAKDTQTKEQLLAKAKEAMKLVNNPEVIPTSRRTPILPQLNRITEDIGLVERTINQEKELVVAVADIGKAESAGDTVKAFQIHHDLLKRYPSLRDNPALKDSVAKILERERVLVKVVENPITPHLNDGGHAGDFRVVLANRKGSGESKPENPVATILAAGSVYALDVGSGQILWSRSVGQATRTTPVRISNQPDADVILVDRQQHELVRVKARTGQVAWRFPVGEDCSEPTVSGTRMYVSTISGRIIEIDVTSGESKRHVAIPQKLTVSPAGAADQPYLFQVGEHSNVYVLNADSLKCEDVVYLGHKAGSVEVSPLLLLGHAFIAENVGSNSRVHALKVRTSGEGTKLFPTQEPLTAIGRIVVPLVVYSRRLLLLTDRGEIRVFDVDKSKNENSVTSTGRQAPTPDDPLIRYPLADATTLWVADNKLTKYTVQVTKKEINRDTAITAVGDTFVAPLQIFGTTLVHTRRVENSTGVTISAIHVDNPRQILWQTNVGVPAGRIAVNPATNEIVAISSGAALYQINGDVLKSGYTDTPTATTGSGSAHSFTEPIDFSPEVVALFNPAASAELLVYDATASTRLRIVSLQLGEGKATCTPVAFQGGLLTPVDGGSVLLLKLSDGTNQILPFQPKLEPGVKTQWRRPAVVGDGREFVVADDDKNIYRVGIKDQPMPQLADLATNRLEVGLVSGLAAAGSTVYGAVRMENTDVIVAISASDLKVTKEWDLKGHRVTWGPENVNGSVMFVTDERELRCFTAEQSELWEKPAVMHGQPAGRPWVQGDDFVFASVLGVVWRIASSSGAEVGKAEVGESLSTGPVGFKGRILLCGNDGTLHVIPMPSAPPAGT